jgi:hypothetical protein
VATANYALRSSAYVEEVKKYEEEEEREISMKEKETTSPAKERMKEPIYTILSSRRQQQRTLPGERMFRMPRL